MMTDDSQGVIYIATGETFIEEAITSAKSLKRHNDLSVTLFTDRSVNSKYFDDVCQLTDPDYDFGDSILTREMVPYDRNLFIDTDTYICGDITPVYELLNRFDIAAAHNPGSRTAEDQEGYTADAPKPFPQYNTGVILFKKSEKVNQFFDEWRREYFEHKSETAWSLNQPSFRDSLYKSSLSISTLPSEYNLRIKYNGSVGFATDEIKIVHGRHPIGLENISTYLNEKRGQRVYTMKKWPIQVITSRPGIRYYIRTIATEGTEPYTFKGRAIQSVKDRGIINTIQMAIGEIKKKSK